MMSRLKIKHKFLVINAICIVVVLIFSGVLRGLENMRSGETYLHNRVQLQADMVAHNISAAVVFEDWEEARVILGALKSDQAALRAVLASGLHHEVVEYRQAPEIPRFDLYALIGHRESEHHLVTVVSSGDAPVAFLDVYYHDKEVHDAIAGTSIAIAVELVLALFLGVLLLTRMQSKILRPIDKLSELTRHITESEDYSLRGVPENPDEIGQLTKDFNSMLDILEERNQSLEETVRHRTHQLENRNHELAIQIIEREKSEKARLETEKKFRQAFINAPIGMALVDAELSIWQPNREMEVRLGVSGTSTPLEKLICPPYRARLCDEFDRLVRGELGNFEQNVECIDPEGGELHAILSFSSIRDESNQFQYAVLQIRDVTESRKLAAKLEHQATHDDLTGLPNRRVLHSAFLHGARASREKSKTSRDNFNVLCLLDLDQFKIVNDNCGHAGGDELLCQVAKLLLQTVREKDLVVRLGGDEFAILLRDCDKPTMTRLTESIREAVERMEFVWKGHTFRLGATIGATVVGKNERDVSLLLQRADAACYIAKDSGRNRVYIIHGDQDKDMSERQSQMRWLQKINDALENEDFVLFAQPIAKLQSETLSQSTGQARSNDNGKRIEVLLRMRDKDTGSLVMPGAFIPVAERYGLSTKLDHWVVTTLIRSLKENPTLVSSDTSYWVNLSGMSLGNDNFVRSIETAVRGAQLTPGLLNFEITETAMIQNISKLSPAMSRLQNLGCKFALDDFGSGTSSFGYLKNLPVEYLKIDGMFVRNILNNEIDLIFVKSIIDIARVMEIQVVAEFVESLEIAAKLKEIGADFGQGYALGRPVPLLFLVESDKSFVDDTASKEVLSLPTTTTNQTRP